MPNKCLNCKTIIHFSNRKTQKYCNEKCIVEYKKKTRYHRKFMKKSLEKRCKICRRNILKVGQRKGASKYCSDRSMVIAQDVRVRGQKTIYVKIPIKDYYKLFL